MADLIRKYRIPEAKVKPLADAIRKDEPGERDEDGKPIVETDEEVIDRCAINHFMAIEQRYRGRQARASAAVDPTLVRKEP